jgi:hypothetical protein
MTTILFLCENVAGDTEWNRNLVGSYLRYWIRSIQMSTEKSPSNYAVWFMHRNKPAEDRLHFIVKTDELTGKPRGPAWQNFGYHGPRFHDGHIYGKVDKNHQFTGSKFVSLNSNYKQSSYRTTFNVEYLLNR